MELPCAADKDNPMLIEIEAAEALAALARCSATGGGAASCSEEATLLLSEDQEAAASHENKYTMATSALISGVTDRDAPTKLRSKSNQWRNLTESEKEARRLRRILANRESARQTVRRRQAMHMELTRKAVDLLEENENLKKEKELAVEAYNSLKNRNKFLKLQVANAKKAESREIKEEPNSFQAEKPTAATTSSLLSLYNQPSLIPFFWSSLPSPNAIHYQYPFHSNLISLTESSLQHRDIFLSHPRPEGNSLIVSPLPWVLPFPSYGPTLHSSSNTEKRTNETPSTHHCIMPSSSDNLFGVENNELLSKLNMLMKASSCTDSAPVGSAIGTRFNYPVNSGDRYGLQSRTLLTTEKLSCIRQTRNFSQYETSDPYAATATDNVFETLPKENTELVIYHHKKPENVLSAIKARRRRKELMMLRNVKYHQARIHSAYT